MTSFQQYQHQLQQHASHSSSSNNNNNPTNERVCYEIINNKFYVSEPNDKSKLKKNYSLVCYLSIVAVLCFTITFSFNGLMRRFHRDRCFLDTEFIFTTVTVTNNNATPVAENSVAAHVRIDNTATKWSPHGHCDCVSYPPVILGMSAIIWASLFYICSLTDKNNRSLLPSPWRIVLPAMIFATFMAVISIYYNFYSNHLLANVCDQLTAAYDEFNSRNHTNGPLQPPCHTLIRHFTTSTPTLTPSILYYLFYIGSYAVTAMWLLVVILLSIRCVFGTDFEHTLVEIRPLNPDGE